jgi:hypothetical protein
LFVYESSTPGKTYGLKAQCYWEHLVEHHWELEEYNKNIWEKTRNPSHPSKTQKEKKLGPFECLSSLLIGHMIIMALKLPICHHFQPEQNTPA